MGKRVHVAVAVVRDQQGRILIARRPSEAHQGGKLEFPGGKVELGESVPQALQRELYEELGIHCTPAAMQPLIKINHQYADKSVCLDVWQLSSYSGHAYGKEGQPIFWLHADELQADDFPAANAPIISALNLPQQLMVSPDIRCTEDEIVAQINMRIQRHNVECVILRLPRIDAGSYASIAAQLVTRWPQVRWQVHSDISLAKQLGAGLHLPAKLLNTLAVEQWGGVASLSASIHSAAELKRAAALGVNFAVLGPVQATHTHPHADTLGWACFADIVASASMPVYALGGMQRADTAKALACGAQGVAGIGLFARD